MIRLILAVTYLILFLVLGIPSMLILWIIGRFNPGARDRAAKGSRIMS